MNEKSGRPLDGELTLINQYTRREMTEEDVYVFSIVLCDNEIDRDIERFSDEALDTLKSLFEGVTGVMDHVPSADNQSARIFSCHTEQLQDQHCSDGRIYRRLCARAYIPKSEGNEELILSLDSGIKKEVSVGCAVKKRICSICGEDITSCHHIKGKNYSGKLCYAQLCEPVDAYEWSFVAVPAQKAAGVIKSYAQGGEMMDVEKKLFNSGEQRFSAEEIEALAKKLETLRQQAAQGEYYRKKLTDDVRALSAAALPELGKETLDFIVDKMSIEQLDDLKKAFEKKAAEKFPLKPQLFRNRENEKNHNMNDNTNYKNI